MPLFRRVVVALLIGIAVVIVWRLRETPRVAPAETPRAPKSAAALAPSAATPVSIKSEATAPQPAVAAGTESDAGRIATADELNAPDGTIQRDLEILVTLFEDWRSFFPGEGNPWGDNAEITAKLMGQNKRKLVFIEKAHRALNADGELCDRWGTPFRFHALAGDHMEIRSAGPDKVFGTSDDASVTPP